MAFGQQSGRPATARQLKDLMALLENAGYTSFRDARGPMGFTQRQGGGKFTTDEADAFIQQLEAEAEGGPEGSDAPPSGPAPTPAQASLRKGVPPAAIAGGSATERREARQATVLRDMPAKLLAADLERRGWIVIPPEGATAPDPTAQD